MSINLTKKTEEQTIREWIMNWENWTGFEEGFEGRNFNHHWKQEKDHSEDEIKTILVDAYKGELDYEFDGENIMLVIGETSRHREGIELDLLEWDLYANDIIDVGYDKLCEIVSGLFDKEPDFLEAVNAQ